MLANNSRFVCLPYRSRAAPLRQRLCEWIVVLIHEKVIGLHGTEFQADLLGKPPRKIIRIEQWQRLQRPDLGRGYLLAIMAGVALDVTR